MKRTYIAPQTDINKLNLQGSIMDFDFGDQSNTGEVVSTNSTIFDDADIEMEIVSSPNLWDE